MIHVLERHRRPDEWDDNPSKDPRCEGLLDLYDHLRYIMLGGDDFIPHPSELAAMFRQQADLIDLWTDYDMAVDTEE